MCSLLSVIAAKSDYLYKANEVYYNLHEYEDTFNYEVQILSYVKCMLLKSEELSDFDIDGTYVTVYETSSGYELLFDEYTMDIEVYDKQIIDFSISK